MSLMSLMELKYLGDKIVAKDVSADNILAMAKKFDINMTPETATMIAEKVPNFVADADTTLSGFVSNGGLLQMLEAQMSGNHEHAPSAGRCPHCQNLVFF